MARFDAASGRHVAGDAPRWTADRPAYGEAVLVEGTTAGMAAGAAGSSRASASSRALRSSVSTIRAPTRTRAAPDTGPVDADGAFPQFTGAASIAVAYDARRDRYLAAYAPPLGGVLV